MKLETIATISTLLAYGLFLVMIVSFIPEPLRSAFTFGNLFGLISGFVISHLSKRLGR